MADDGFDTTTNHASEGSDAHAEAPQQVPEPPVPARSVAQNRLRDQLLAYMSPEAAAVVSRSCVDPADARAKLASPRKIRVLGGGALTVIETGVWMHTLAPYPANPREEGEQPLPIQGQESNVLPPPVPAPEHPDNEIVFTARSREHFATVQRDSAAHLVATNSYIDTIVADGVLSPVLAVVTRVRHADGSREAIALSTGDGSSRTSSGHSALEMDTADAFYKYAADDRALKGFVGEVAVGVRQYHAGEIPQPPAVRALVVPALIVIGCEGADIIEGVQGYVGLAHVAPPRPWSETGTIAARAAAALRALEAAGIPAMTTAWMAGQIRQVEAQGSGLPHLFDERSLLVVRTLQQNYPIASAGIRRVDLTIQQVRKPKMAAVAADCALRPVRGRFARRRELEVVIDSLSLLYNAVWDDPWTASQRSPRELCTRALGELERGKAGAAARELMLLAAYHLLSQKVLFNLYHGSGDRRLVHVILLGLMESPRGLQQFARVVEDCRAGRDPAKVDVQGQPVLGADGMPVVLTNEILRTELFPLDESPKPTPPGDSTPETQLRQMQIDLARAVRSLRDRMSNVRAVRGSDGRPLVEARGLPTLLADEMMDALKDIDRDLYHWRRVGQDWKTDHPGGDAPSGDSTPEPEPPSDAVKEVA